MTLGCGCEDLGQLWERRCGLLLGEGCPRNYLVSQRRHRAFPLVQVVCNFFHEYFVGFQCTSLASLWLNPFLDIFFFFLVLL